MCHEGKDYMCRSKTLESFTLDHLGLVANKVIFFILQQLLPACFLPLSILGMEYSNSFLFSNSFSQPASLSLAWSVDCYPTFGWRV